MLARVAAATLATALVATALLVIPAASPAQAHPSTFPDVTETNPAHDAIESLAARQIVAGTTGGAFQPNGLLTRGQAAKMLVVWHGGETTSLVATPFPDVNGTCAQYVQAALTRGWVSGYPDGTFRPQVPLTRAQAAVVLVRSLGLETQAQALSDAQTATVLGPFVDDAAVAASARPYVALAVMNGLFAGDSERLAPLAPMTRAQFSLVLYRADTLVDASATNVAATDGEATATGDPVAPQRAAYTAEEQALAAFMDLYLFGPHDSPVTGEMVLQNADWYGIPPLSQLVIMAAETSLGDPRLGGALARRNNFGCMRYHGSDTSWGLLSDGRIWVAGRDWYSFPSPEVGMAAWGRYLKSAVNGFYVPILSASHPDWERFAAVYYGRGVSGFGSYVSRLNAIENRFRVLAADHGVSF